MKRGFTLIELLAVILILGIIALIAIPTVNNILEEARMGAFRTSVNQVAKSAEENC
ncbi:MAG: prepilin-type N-terminal cleavage/methylation domain-containing protein [Bacilli bacterium]|nr:prepilin-type N-terminal cleavage/methylation domain-containing protein [Bacilli bacterium]